MISTQMVAVALVAACKITGADPAQAFDEGGLARRARVMAAAAMKARKEATAVELARLFQVGNAVCLSPSQLDRLDITTDHLLRISEALAEAGMVFDAAPAPAAEPSQDKPARPTPVRPSQTESQGGRRKPDSATPRFRGRGVQRLGPREPLAAAPRSPRVTRLRPVNERIVGWSRAYVARGVDAEFLAELFDVHPDALLDALAQPEARAA